MPKIEAEQSIPHPEAPKPTREELFNPEGRYRIAEYISFPEGEGVFTEKREKYYDDFLKDNPQIVERLTMGGLLVGEGSENWKNLSEHNIMAGVTTHELGELVGLPEEELKKVTFLGGIHDWDKRKDWNQAKVSTEIVDGIEIIKWDPAMIAKSEISKEGPLSVTGTDLRGYEDWDWKRKILRFTDSSLMSIGMTHNKLAPIEDRFAELDARTKEKNPSFNETQGREIYGEGKLLFTELTNISKWAEGKIHGEILAKHPELAEEYPDQGSLHRLVTNKIIEDINAIQIEEEPKVQPVTIFDQKTATTSQPLIDIQASS